MTTILLWLTRITITVCALVVLTVVLAMIAGWALDDLDDEEEDDYVDP